MEIYVNTVWGDKGRDKGEGQETEQKQRFTPPTTSATPTHREFEAKQSRRDIIKYAHWIERKNGTQGREKQGQHQTDIIRASYRAHGHRTNKNTTQIMKNNNNT